MVMLFMSQISQVFELAPWLSVLVVRHSPKGSIRHGLEISVPSLRGVMLMLLLVMVACSPEIVSVGWISWVVVDVVLVHHLIIYSLL